MPIATYDKLAIARWLPAGTEKVLWLDADLLVLGDLEELWDLDLGTSVLAATQDARVPTVDARFGVGPYAAFGLPAGARYFNAGVLSIDLRRWRGLDVEGRSLAYLKRHRARVYFWDQEALNVAVAGRWKELPPAWNWSPIDGGDGLGLELGPGPDVPRILHFSGHLKPWRYPRRDRLHDLYYRDLDQTAWEGWRPPDSWWSDAVRLYRASGLRRLALPLESWALPLLRATTLRYASAADLDVTEPPDLRVHTV